jgi:membrane associated rhomboid family serine protease
VPPSASGAPRPLAVALSIGFCIGALVCCPTHGSFERYLTAQATHPSAWLPTGLAKVAERLRVSLAAESRSYLLFRMGTLRERAFIGAFGTWVALPIAPSLQLHTASVCHGAESMPPHQLFALLSMVYFVLMQLAPRFWWRHASCSLRAIRSGRLWTVLTSNLASASFPHLLHNIMTVMNLGASVHGALGCERELWLLLVACLASSAGALLWHGILGGAPAACSVGGSGVAMAFVAANAALFPRVTVFVYGIEMSAAHLPVAYLLLDAIGQRGGTHIDVSAHAGGAAAGWLLARRWKPWWYA